jgi:hypothetical protein
MRCFDEKDRHIRPRQDAAKEPAGQNVASDGHCEDGIDFLNAILPGADGPV